MNINDYEWKQVECSKTPKYIKFHKVEGNCIWGKLVSIEKKDSLFKEDTYNTYFIKNPDGNIHKINSTIKLKELMDNINIGDMVHITYLGSTKTNNGNNLDTFEVLKGVPKE